MKRFLLISLLALPLSAQYPVGSRFQRGDDPRWADPNFDDRQWVKQSDYRANSYDDYLQNRPPRQSGVTQQHRAISLKTKKRHPPNPRQPKPFLDTDLLLLLT